MPDATIASQQVFSSLRAVLTSGISLHARILLPGVEERLHGTPAVFNVVGALE
jgi:hypothetical protein